MKRRKSFIKLYDLDVEKTEEKNPNKDKYDFIYPFNHLVSLDEQKIKVEELTKISEIKKTTN